MIAAICNGVQFATRQLERRGHRKERTFVSTLPWASFESPPAHYCTNNSLPLSMPTAPLNSHPNYSPPIFILHYLNHLIQNLSLQSVISQSSLAVILTHLPSRAHNQVINTMSDLSTAQRKACCNTVLGSCPCRPFPLMSPETSSCSIAATLSGVG